MVFSVNNSILSVNNGLFSLLLMVFSLLIMASSVSVTTGHQLQSQCKGCSPRRGTMCFSHLLARRLTCGDSTTSTTSTPTSGESAFSFQDCAVMGLIMGILSLRCCLIQVVFHPNVLSPGWFFIRVISHQLVYHHGHLTSEWSITSFFNYQGGFSPEWSFTWVVSHQGAVSSGWSVNKVVCH